MRVACSSFCVEGMKCVACLIAFRADALSMPPAAGSRRENRGVRGDSALERRERTERLEREEMRVEREREEKYERR